MVRREQRGPRTDVVAGADGTVVRRLRLNESPRQYNSQLMD